MFYYLKYSTSSGLFPYIGLLKPCDGPTFSGPPNRKPNEGGTSTRGFRKFGFLKLILSKTLNPSSSVGLKCKANHMFITANEFILAMYCTITVEFFFNKCVCFIFTLGCLQSNTCNEFSFLFWEMINVYGANTAVFRNT